MKIAKHKIEEIESFLLEKAPGVTFEVKDNPAFQTTTVRLSLNIQLTKLLNDLLLQSGRMEPLGLAAVEMLAEVQKAAVVAIGMEDYVKTRQLEALTRLEERLVAGSHPQQALEDTEAELGMEKN